MKTANNLKTVILVTLFILIPISVQAWNWNDITTVIKQHSITILAATTITGFSGLSGYLWYQNNVKAQKHHMDNLKKARTKAFDDKWKTKQMQLQDEQRQKYKAEAEQKTLVNIIETNIRSHKSRYINFESEKLKKGLIRKHMLTEQRHLKNKARLAHQRQQQQAHEEQEQQQRLKRAKQALASHHDYSFGRRESGSWTRQVN